MTQKSLLYKTNDTFSFELVLPDIFFVSGVETIHFSESISKFLFNSVPSLLFFSFVAFGYLLYWL